MATEGREERSKERDTGCFLDLRSRRFAKIERKQPRDPRSWKKKPGRESGRQVVEGGVLKDENREREREQNSWRGLRGSEAKGELAGP